MAGHDYSVARWSIIWNSTVAASRWAAATGSGSGMASVLGDLIMHNNRRHSDGFSIPAAPPLQSRACCGRYATKENLVKWLTRILGIIIAVPILFIFSWYLINFLPHANELEQKVNSGQKIVSGVSDIQKLAVLAESNSGIRNYAIRQAYVELSLNERYQKTPYWHLNTVLWYFYSKLHYNENEMFFMWSTYAPYEKGTGLQNSAKYYFKKELKDLSLREKTEIVAMVKGPSIYKHGSERLNKRVDSILGIN